MSNRIIKQVAVLGSGIMGSSIACHIAGAGIPVLLLDIPANSDDQDKPGKTKTNKNKIAQDALAAAIKRSPSPVYTRDVVDKITIGNFEDNLKDISECDWIIEAVVENLTIKKQLFDKVEQYRRPGTIITTNTSGIPIHLLAEGRSDDFKEHFCGTHFFNPPRYLQLLEIIPTSATKEEVTSFLTRFGDKFLGKTTVLCKDTPAFIANRIGVYSIMLIFSLMEKYKLTVDEIDLLTGRVIGRPKSATFRTADLVGIDTLVKVSKGIAENCPDDESLQIFSIPGWLQRMIENNWLGDKTGQGFYKKVKKTVTPAYPGAAASISEILTLDLSTLEYVPQEKLRFASLDAARTVEDLFARTKMLYNSRDKAGDFYRSFHHGLFSYVSHRVPDISDEIYRIDDAMKAGFGWETGPFEAWDLLGLADTVAQMKKDGLTVADWVDDMLTEGHISFFKMDNGRKLAWSPSAKTYVPVPGSDELIILSRQSEKLIWKNNSCTLYDIGDDVLALGWNTKMGTMGGDVLNGIQVSVEKAEKDYKGLVIANEGANFSAGANIGLILMLAVEQEYDELEQAVRLFQQTTMRVRYSSVPVVVAPHGLTLGGGCELSLHADRVCAAAETYTGLVELGVGLIPAGGGTKEFVLRASDEVHHGEPDNIPLQNRFRTIAMAATSTSAHEAFGLGIYRKGLDKVVMNPNRRIAEAKRSVTELYDAGYLRPVPRKNIRVLGRSALGGLLAGVHAMNKGNYATEHDALVARKLAFVMCGGDLSQPTLVSESYLLDLEREAFLSLCSEKKTLERLQSVIKTGKPIRN